MQHQIKKPNVPASSGGKVATPQIPTTGFIQFSFKYAQLPASGKFSIAGQQAEYFHELVQKLPTVSNMTTAEFVGKETKAIKNHVIRFPGTSEPGGFSCLNDTLREQTFGCAHQFGVKRHDYGRVHGFIIRDTFFVVWYDPDHSLYP
mgnify:CR=1 FL=1